MASSSDTQDLPCSVGQSLVAYGDDPDPWRRSLILHFAGVDGRMKLGSWKEGSKTMLFADLTYLCHMMSKSGSSLPAYLQ